LSMPTREIVVSDSSPLIWLGKINKLHLLRRLFGEILVPERVRLEVLKGESVDAYLIREALEEGWIRVEVFDGALAAELLDVSGLHRGEAEAILLARELDALLIVDDREASVVARAFGIRCLGTLGVLLSGLSKGLMEYEDFIECLDDMIGLGFRLSIEVYKKVLREAKRLAK
jgi:uncharacterized protein